MMPNGRLFVLGIGGHARSVVDVAVAAGCSDIVLVDAAALPGETFAGFPSISGLPGTLDPSDRLVPGIGDNAARRRACAGLAGSLVTLISPDASIGPVAKLGPGTVIGRHAHVGPNASVGAGVIVNTGGIVEHDCRIGDFVHVAVGATVAGHCDIGENAMIGAGATVIDGISVCAGAIVGAGATVVRNIVRPGIYVGTPARPLHPH